MSDEAHEPMKFATLDEVKEFLAKVRSKPPRRWLDTPVADMAPENVRRFLSEYL